MFKFRKMDLFRISGIMWRPGELEEHFAKLSDPPPEKLEDMLAQMGFLGNQHLEIRGQLMINEFKKRGWLKSKEEQGFKLF